MPIRPREHIKLWPNGEQIEKFADIYNNKN